MARRHWVAILAFLGFANIYAMRANLSVAIVEMTTGSDRTINGTQQHVSYFKYVFNCFSSVSPFRGGRNEQKVNKLYPMSAVY